MNKYHSRRVRYDGHDFDSQKEARRYAELKILERAGKISRLSLQEKFVLIPAQRDADGKIIERECSYYADFVYEDESGATVVEDAKGKRTKEYIIKRKLMLKMYGFRIKEV